MDFYAASALANFITTLFLGVIVLARNPRSKLNLTFFAFSLDVSLWSLCYYIWQISITAESALFWSRALMAFAIFIPVLYLHFIRFLHKAENSKTVFLTVVYCVFAVFLIADLFSSYFIPSVRSIDDFQFWPVAGPIYYLFLALWVGFMVYNAYFLFSMQKKSEGLQRLQIKYVFIGFVLGLIGGITNYFMWFGIPIPPFGNILVTVYVGLNAYAIIKHRFFDIRLVVARTVAYASLVAIFAAFYTGSIYWISRSFLSESVSSNQALISALLALFIAFTFQPLKNFLERVTNKIFFRNGYSSNELLSKLTKVMASTLDLESLTKNTLHELLDTMHIAHGTFIIFDNNNIYPPVYEGFSSQPHYDVATIRKFSGLDRTVIFEEETDESIKGLMRQFDFSISLSLHVGDKQHGLLVLGEKKSGDIYSTQDIEVLGIFGPEISVAVQNAKAYEEIRRFNITLKEEVDRATKDLQVANIKLKELDQLKDDFVSVASHELRTPMTAIRSYVWMALNRPDIKLSEKMHRYLDRTLISTERLINLVNDMLNVSRIESGRVEITPKVLDIAALVSGIVEDILPKAEEKMIRVDILKTPVPQVFADGEKVQQILLNLLGNALKFTPIEGTITISFLGDGNGVDISVKDSGVGITKEDLSRLFKKFGRLDNSYVAAATSGGTGLGLYISKSLVELMGGKIWVSSEGVGKGTTFTFSLPAATKEVISQAQQYTKVAVGGEAKALEPVAI